MIFHDYASRLEAFQNLTKNLDFKQPIPVEAFLKAPASTKYHGNYEGGLFDHSFTVYQELNGLTKNMALEWERPESPIIIGLFHDLCKIDQYIKNTEPSGHPYIYDDENFISGHGDKSVIYLQTNMDLTFEEIACIRWHMGAFDDEEKWNFYTRAVQRFSNVLWTHTADMIASHILGV